MFVCWINLNWRATWLKQYSSYIVFLNEEKNEKKGHPTKKSLLLRGKRTLSGAVPIGSLKLASVWSPGVLGVMLLTATDGSKDGRKEKAQTRFIAGVLNLLLPSREASRWSINWREQKEHAPLSMKNMWADFQYFSKCKFSQQAHRAFCIWLYTGVTGAVCCTMTF